MNPPPSPPLSTPEQAVPVLIHYRGLWHPGQVSTAEVATTQRLPESVAREVEAEWTRETSIPGRLLFDGPMSRFELAQVTPDHFHLDLSRTSYKLFHILHTRRQDLLGPGPFGGSIAARPVGVSTLVLSSDGHILLGRRSDRVAYYPGRIHPFAGALEPAEAADLFATLYRELNEELHLAPQEIADTALIGLVEDTRLRQPEVILTCHVSLTADDIRARLDPQEHDGVVSIARSSQSIAALLESESALTPVCRGALMILGDRA